MGVHGVLVRLLEVVAAVGRILAVEVEIAAALAGRLAIALDLASFALIAAAPLATGAACCIHLSHTRRWRCNGCAWPVAVAPHPRSCAWCGCSSRWAGSWCRSHCFCPMSRSWLAGQECAAIPPQCGIRDRAEAPAHSLRRLPLVARQTVSAGRRSSIDPRDAFAGKNALVLIGSAIGRARLYSLSSTTKHKAAQ